MRFKETIRTNKQVTEREFEGTIEEIMELFDYLCEEEIDMEIEGDRWML